MRLLLFILIFPALNAAAKLPFQKVTISSDKSRGLFLPSRTPALRPAILMIGGQGPHGPETMIPARYSADGKSFAFLPLLAGPFVKENFNVLLLGKPGIDYFKGFIGDDYIRKWPHYDSELYRSVTWSKLVDNVAAGVEFLRKQPGVDQNRIYLLGHSQGSVVITDVIVKHPELKIAGLIMLGFSGQPIKEINEWAYQGRLMDFFKNDVDRKHKGYIDRQDAAKWGDPIVFPDFTFHWNWKTGQDKMSLREIEKRVHEEAYVEQMLEHIRTSNVYSEIWGREPHYKAISKLKMPIYIFNGEFDMDTPKDELSKVKKACAEQKKTDCFLTTIPAVGHGFSEPRGPRKHPLLDITLGPPQPVFLEGLAHKLGGN